MNKHKRHQVQNRTKFVKRLASEIKPFLIINKVEKAYATTLNKWYHKNLVTPLHAANTVKFMSSGACQKLAFAILNKRNWRYEEFIGNFFREKFIMCIFIRNEDWLHKRGILEEDYILNTQPKRSDEVKPIITMAHTPVTCL